VYAGYCQIETWNDKSLERLGSLKTAGIEFAVVFYGKKIWMILDVLKNTK
jgi:hypothetical protein